MPSAQQKEFDEPLVITDRRREELQLLLNELRASNGNNLNSIHGRGAVLFAEGEPVRGAYIMRSGRASVSISSSEGRVVILRMARPGDVLGLNSVIHNGSYDTTVKAVEPCRTDFIPRAELIELMEQSEAGARAILKILSRDFTELTDRAKLVLLPQTVSGRLARLLLEGTLEKVPTHEQIAQMICTSRETVTRLLIMLGKQQVIRVKSGTILILDRLALERIR
jgi:CRP/FNR family transcriptional regulator